MSNNELLTELRNPFHPSVIEFKPGSVTKDGTKALAMPYADVRAYQSRLDEVCGMDWSVTYTPWGDKIVCHLTIAGVTRSSTGEADARSEKSEIGGTSAEAQAFKRAAAMFGLGRYLYNFPPTWVEFDQGNKRFSEAGLNKLSGAIHLHYKREMGGDATQTNGHTNGASTGPANGHTPSPDALNREFDRLGTELYGEHWPQVSASNAVKISGGSATSANDLTTEQLQKLIAGMKTLQAKRQAQAN